jgi:hypothetical protein
LCIEPILCKHGNVLIAENFDVRLWPRITKRFERGQSENKIADCAAADHQDAVHASAVAAFCERRNSSRWRFIGGHNRRYNLILRKREFENHAAVNQHNGMQKAPAENAASAPIDLVAKDVRNCHPEQARDNQQVSKDCHE